MLQSLMQMVYICTSKLIQLGKIRVGIVNYLNTLPLLYGLEHSALHGELEIVKDYPARIAESLIRGEVDLALVPVGVLPQLRSYRIVSDYGIASNGPVASVCLFSQVPIAEVEEVYMDYQSLTSSLLVRLLFRDFWKKEVRYIDTDADFSEEIRSKRAGLLIGDRCLAFRSKAVYIYDLGEVWKLHTGLPFVFAVWAAVRSLPASFLAEFNAANANGVAAIEQLIKETKYAYYDMGQYYRNNIRYYLDKQMHTGMNCFLERITAIDR